MRITGIEDAALLRSLAEDVPDMAAEVREQLRTIADYISLQQSDELKLLGGAEPVAAYLLIKPRSPGWAVMPKDMTPDAREIYEADGITIEPLFLGVPPAPAAAGAALAVAHVGDSRFESWFSEKDMKGLGTKQLARDAYAAGMEDPLAAPASTTGLAAQLSTAVDAIEAQHDPFCMSVLRGKDCDCGKVVALAATPAPEPYQKALDIRIQQGWQLGGNACPVLYTDTINGEQVRRDDLWLATTAGLKGATETASGHERDATPQMVLAGLAAAEQCDGVLGSIYPSELKTIYAAMVAARENALKAAQPIEREDGNHSARAAGDGEGKR